LCFKCHDVINHTLQTDTQASASDSIGLITGLLHDIKTFGGANSDASELAWLLTSNTYLRSVIEAHDTIAQKQFEGICTLRLTPIGPYLIGLV
jgi:hypothetical protein